MSLLEIPGDTPPIAQENTSGYLTDTSFKGKWFDREGFHCESGLATLLTEITEKYKNTLKTRRIPLEPNIKKCIERNIYGTFRSV
jgi:hypothetical protein